MKPESCNGEGDICMAYVALVPCESYQEEQVYGAVKEGVDLLGGIEHFFHPEERILLKPNLLGKAAPEKALAKKMMPALARRI